MGGKSQHYVPRPPSREDLGLDSESSKEDDPVSEGNAAGDDPLLNDEAIDTQFMDSAQPEFGGMYVNIPHVDAIQLSQSSEMDSSFPEGHMVQGSDIVNFIQHKEKKVHVTQLQWDKTTTMGQIRALNPTLVAHYARRLKSSPPRKLVRILAKATTGMLVRRVGVLICLLHRRSLRSHWRPTHFRCTAGSIQVPWWPGAGHWDPTGTAIC